MRNFFILRLTIVGFNKEETMNSCYKVYLNDDTKIIEELENKIQVFFNGYKTNCWSIPALIEENILVKCGYFSIMPNQLTRALNEMAVDLKQSNVKYYLTPAACLHLYPHIKSQTIKNELITTKARVYRWEDGNYTEGVRMWDFTVRECVAIGTVSFVKEFLEDFMNKAMDLAKTYNIDAQIVQASDHFYPSKENQLKQRIQLANNLKYELQVNIDGKIIALASFNYHGFHFSKTFDFDEEGEIVSGCVGFGIDRWLTVINYLKGELK